MVKEDDFTGQLESKVIESRCGKGGLAKYRQDWFRVKHPGERTTAFAGLPEKSNRYVGGLLIDGSESEPYERQRPLLAAYHFRADGGGDFVESPRDDNVGNVTVRR